MNAVSMAYVTFSVHFSTYVKHPMLRTHIPVDQKEKLTKFSKERKFPLNNNLVFKLVHL